MPMPATRPVMTWVCGFSPSWGSSVSCSRSCYDAGNWVHTDMVWRRLPLPGARLSLPRLPICEDSDSSLGAGFECEGLSLQSKLPNAKAFVTATAARSGPVFTSEDREKYSDILEP